MRYSQEEKIFIAKKYTILRSTSLVQRAWRTKYKNYKAPFHGTILNIARKFENIGLVDNLNSRNKKITQKRKDAKMVLERVVAEKPDLSTRKSS